ncbi:hypothetical protein EJ110_NYTH26295 [Nymphaea thermarum]|nr:hypothetical protein EJ110_NYTH26295 [Nymphaea thermarum]
MGRGRDGGRGMRQEGEKNGEGSTGLGHTRPLATHSRIAVLPFTTQLQEPSSSSLSDCRCGSRRPSPKQLFAIVQLWESKGEFVVILSISQNGALFRPFPSISVWITTSSGCYAAINQL